MKKTIAIADVQYTDEDCKDLREKMITLRNAALDQNDMEWAVTLSHVIAYFSVTIPIVFNPGEDENENRNRNTTTSSTARHES